MSREASEQVDKVPLVNVDGSRRAPQRGDLSDLSCLPEAPSLTFELFVQSSTRSHRQRADELLIRQLRVRCSCVRTQCTPTPTPTAQHEQLDPFRLTTQTATTAEVLQCLIGCTAKSDGHRSFSHAKLRQDAPRRATSSNHCFTPRRRQESCYPP